MRLPISIKTSCMEIYDKLPLIKYHDEIIFSCKVPLQALTKIVGNFKRNGIDVELQNYNGRYIMIKRSPFGINLDVLYRK